MCIWKVLTHSLASILSLCAHSSLLHHTILCLPVDPLCLLLLRRKGRQQHEQVLGKNKHFFCNTRQCSLHGCAAVEFTFYSANSATPGYHVNAESFPLESANFRQRESLCLHFLTWQTVFILWFLENGVKLPKAANIMQILLAVCNTVCMFYRCTDVTCTCTVGSHRARLTYLQRAAMHIDG